MKTDYITFRSITPAQHGQRILRQAGIDTILQRTPRYMEQQGCGYCLRLRPEDRQRAIELLQSNRINFRKVYTGDQQLLEVQL